jgi:hypothetical protein
MRRVVLAFAAVGCAGLVLLAWQKAVSPRAAAASARRTIAPPSSAAAGTRLIEAVATTRREKAPAESVRRFIASLDETEVATVLREPSAYFPAGMTPSWRRALLAHWIHLNPAAACAWLRESGNRGLAEEAFAGPAASSVPVVAALTLFEKLPPETDSQAGFDLLARAKPEDIKAWLQDSPSTALRLRTLVQFCQLHPEQAREKILAAALLLPEGTERDQVTSVILGEWSRTDPLAVVARLDQMPGSSAKTMAWGSLVAQWAENHPAQAAQIAVQVADGPARHQAVIAAVSGWARRDPPATAAWVIQFPEGDLRNEAMDQLVFAWALRDVAAVERWTSQLPSGPARDAALVTIGQVAARSNRRALRGR